MLIITIITELCTCMGPDKFLSSSQAHTALSNTQPVLRGYIVPLGCFFKRFFCLILFYTTWSSALIPKSCSGRSSDGLKAKWHTFHRGRIPILIPVSKILISSFQRGDSDVKAQSAALGLCQVCALNNAGCVV